MRLKHTQIPAVRDMLIRSQDNRCALCSINLSGVMPCLDHDHTTGRIRSVLCQNCNGIEGKIHNLCRRAKRERSTEQFLVSILEYWKAHREAPTDLLHPTHRTEDEKRVRRNKKARLRRAKKNP
jgi:predicted amidophosphoribosyltransferase